MMKGEGGKPRAFGAGLVSDSEELQYCTSDMSTQLPLDLNEAVKIPYQITGLQPFYFVAESMEDMRKKMT